MGLLAQIQQGEGKTLELKLQLPRYGQIAQTLVAFANTSGGKLVIGVNDQREVIGIADDDIFVLREQITASVLERCYPPLLPEIYTTCLAQGLSAPQIVEKGDFVDVEFYRSQPGLETDDTERLRTNTDDSERLRTNLNDTSQHILLDYLREHGCINRKQAVDLLGKSNTSVYSLLNALLQDGLLERQGQGRATYYVLTKKKYQKE